MNFDDFTTVLFADSKLCRSRPLRGPAKKWARCLMAEWQEPEQLLLATAGRATVRAAAWKREWRSAARQRYRADYGNPMIWLWLLSFVVELILKWWLARRNAPEMNALCTETNA